MPLPGKERKQIRMQDNRFMDSERLTLGTEVCSDGIQWKEFM